MGFFSDLKEDLSQAVNELVPSDTTVAEVAEDNAPESVEDLGKMLEGMDLDNMNLDDAATEELTEDLADTTAADDIDTDDLINDAMADISSFVGTAPEKPKHEAAPIVNKSVASDEVGVITAGMTVVGDIASQGSMNVIGSVTGNIEIQGKLNVTGCIDGDSSASDVYAEGARINGEVRSAGSIKIGQNTIIIGNIFSTSAVIAGAVKGDIDVKGPVILDASAIVMGNIKSKSVQINNGAVIEGLCSQCYADVNPTSFFDDIKKARK